MGRGKYIRHKLIILIYYLAIDRNICLNLEKIC